MARRTRPSSRGRPPTPPRTSPARPSSWTEGRRGPPWGRPSMPYQPIENYGLIGNLRTAALVGMDGSIDWLCLPRFDSPSVFAAILDDQKGGRFRIAPAGDGVSRKQFYWPDTNVLVTRFFTPDGVGEVVDYMPVATPANGREQRRQLIRRVRVTR